MSTKNLKTDKKTFNVNYTTKQLTQIGKLQTKAVTSKSKIIRKITDIGIAELKTMTKTQLVEALKE